MEPKWLELARCEIGKKEVKGNGDNPDIMQYYIDAGHPEIEHDEVSWCAAFVCSQIERSGYASPKTLAARGLLRWGKVLDKPKVGCVAVFWRNSRNGWQGHVGFYLGEDGNNIKLLGGNQSDQVSITTIPKSRLLGYRWPVTATNSRTTKSVVGGAAGAIVAGGSAVVEIVAQSPETAIKVGTELKSTGIPWMVVAGSIVVIMALAIIAYAHWDDLKKNGK